MAQYSPALQDARAFCNYQSDCIREAHVLETLGIPQAGLREYMQNPDNARMFMERARDDAFRRAACHQPFVRGTCLK